MTFEKNHYYLYNGKIYIFVEQNEFDSGYTLYHFKDNDNEEPLILGPDEIQDIKEY
jgi:hypothetical protein